MVLLIVLLCIALFIALLLSFKACVTVAYSDEVRLSVTVLGFMKINLMPRRKKKVRLNKYSKRAVERRRRKEAKKAAQKQAKKRQKKQQKAEKKKLSPEEKRSLKEGKPTLIDNVDMVVSIIKMFFTKFFRHLKIKVARIRIVIGTGDAAQTAVIYGAVCQAVNPLVYLLEKYTNVNKLEDADIAIYPDFLAESTKIDIEVSFSLRVWHLLDIGLGSLKRFIGTRMKASRRAAKKRAQEELEAERQAQRTDTAKK